MKQGNGIVKVFLVVLTLVCALQYFYMLPTRGVEADAEAYAESAAATATPEREHAVKSAARARYLDSMSNETVFSIPFFKDFTYQELKQSQLAFGLDLKGGMSVVLQVDVRDLIIRLSGNSNDPIFLQALKDAKAAQSSEQSDFVTLFADAYTAAGGPSDGLSKIFATNETLRDKINYGDSNASVVQILRQKSVETVALTHQRLRDRIDQLGVVQPNVSLDAARDLIIVELPGISNPERARQFLQSTAKLEFWNVYRIGDPGLFNGFLQADSQLKSTEGGTETNTEVQTEDRVEYVYDDSGNVTDSTIVVDTVQVNPLAQGGPLLTRLQLNNSQGGQTIFAPSVIGIANKRDTSAINKYLNKPTIKTLFPNDVSFKWSNKAQSAYVAEGSKDLIFELYAIKKERNRDEPLLEGDLVTDAKANPNPNTGEVEVSLSMNSEGARIWGQMTTAAANDNNRPIAIVLDNQVVSAPRVNTPITDGRSSISGNFTLQEGSDLAKILQIGKLPADLQSIQENIVGPSLGTQNIRSSLISLAIGFGMVFLFMIMYYGGAGIVAIIALMMNLFFIFGSLASIGTVLTLPGIAGIVLTIGMAVDASVIIYERVREELREGKTLLMSVGDGFKHSYSAIIDANVTTILTAFVLAYFGLGPIKGFAIVLIIGVLCSIFTAVLAGRLIIDWWTNTKGKNLSFWTTGSKNIFTNLDIDWLGKRKIAYIISGGIILAGMVSMFTRGFDLGIDFKGGYSYNVQFPKDLAMDAETLRGALHNELGKGLVIKSVSTQNTFNIVTDYQIENTDKDAQTLVLQALYRGINAVDPIKFDNFKDPDGIGTHITSSSKVGPTIADDIKQSSVYAGIFALLFIFFYIFLRFNKWQFSLGAVAALFHDVLIVISVFSLLHGILPFNLQVDQNFIAAILTVIGYSINDTVVVFDRIREYLNNYHGKPKAEVINFAINHTWSRTVITSLTTLFVVLILFIFGSGSIKGFAFALTVGIVVGTYSSVFVATPIMSDLSDENLEPVKAKKKSFSRAKA